MNKTEAFLKRIYGRLPASMQNLAVSLYGIEVVRRRYGKNFTQLLSELVARDKWSNEQIREFQTRQLISFVRRAAVTVPYYRKKFAELGISANEIQTPEDLLKLPILRKWNVQDNWKDIHSPEHPIKRLRRMQTSGTTGTGMLLDMTWHAHREQWAVWWRYRMRHGLRLGIWSGLFGGHVIVPIRYRNPPFWRVNLPGKTVLFSNYHTSEENLALYIDEIERRGLTWLHGYPSALTLVSHTMLELNRRLPAVRWISTGGESLLTHQRQVIEEAFKLKVIDHYGLGEAVANISQCPAGNMHVDEDFAFTEFIQHPTISGFWKIIGTNFSNPAFPLIRFDTADLAILKEGECDCGLPGRLVDRIIGREEDYITTPQGSRFTQPGFVFMGLLNLREAQIYQKERDLVEIRVVRGRNFGDFERKTILERTREMMGDKMRIEVKYVDAIERTAAGKIKCMVSEVR